MARGTTDTRNKHCTTAHSAVRENKQQRTWVLGPQHRIDSLNEAKIKWYAVLLKDIDSGYILTGDEVVQQIAKGNFKIDAEGEEYKVREEGCQSIWKFQGLDAVIRPRYTVVPDDRVELDYILPCIDEFERRIDGDLGPIATGELIIRGLGSKGGFAYNAIPSDIKGNCHPLLVTAIGSEDNVESRILQAALHVKAACPGISKTVVFVAAKWDARAWRKNRHYFAGIETYLRLSFTEHVRLT